MLNSARSCMLVVLIICLGFCSCGGRQEGNTGTPPPGALGIQTAALPAGALGSSYSATLLAANGTPPYRWALVSGGLPPGLSLAESGQISGTPTQSGNYTFAVRVTDFRSQSAQSSLTLAISTAGSAQVTFNIDPNTTLQVWRALGGLATGLKRDQSVPPCSAIPLTLVDAMLDDLVNGLGMTSLRTGSTPSQAIEATANDNDDPHVRVQSVFDTGFDSTASDVCSNHPRNELITPMIVPFRSKVLANGEPFELHISFDYRDPSQMPPWWQADPEEGAEAVEAYWVWFQSHYGFSPDWFTINEPNGNFFSPNYMGPYVAAIGRRFPLLGANSKMETPTPASVTSGPSMTDTVNSTPGAMQFVGRLAYHGYDYFGLWPSASGITARNDMRARGAALGKELAMTEVCCKSGWDGRYAQGLDQVRDLYLNVVEGRVSYWEPLSAIGVCSTTACVVSSGSVNNFINVSSDLSTYFLQPSYWVMRQFSRYVRPGYVRVAVTCTGCTMTSDRGPDVKALAWKRPNGSMVVNVVNDAGSPVTISLNGLPSGTYEISKLDPTLCASSGGKNRCTPQTTMTALGSGFTLSLPQDAVWTLSQR